MTSWAPSDAAQVRGRFAVRTPPWAFWGAMWVLAAVAEVLALRPELWDRDARLTSPPGRGTVVSAVLPCGS